MTFAIQVFQMLAALLPVIHQAIQEIGPLFPHAAQGEAKADGIVQVVMSTLPPSTSEPHAEAIKAAIPAVVQAISAVRGVADSFAQQDAGSGA
jgi:hypothetical protein